MKKISSLLLLSTFAESHTDSTLIDHCDKHSFVNTFYLPNQEVDNVLESIINETV